MKEDLAILILGRVKSGKTTVGLVIAEALRKAGFEVAFEDERGDFDWPVCARMLVAIREPGSPLLAKLAAKSRIMIKTFQAKKGFTVEGVHTSAGMIGV